MTSPSSSASPSASHFPSRRNFLSLSATSPASPARPSPRYDTISWFALSGSLPSVAAQAAYSSMVMWFAPAAGRTVIRLAASRTHSWVPDLCLLRSRVRDTRLSLQRLQQPLHEQRARHDRGDQRVLPTGVCPVAVDAEPVEG